MNRVLLFLILLENVFQMNGRYIQITAKVPVFEHFLTLHHATFRCASYILEHFCVWWYCPFHAALSHILHFSGAFKHFPATSVPKSHQRAGKAPIFEHFPNTTRLHKPPRSVAHPLTSNTFCSVVPLLTCSLSHILHFWGTFEHFLTLLTPKRTGDIQRPEESSHCWTLFPL